MPQLAQLIDCIVNVVCHVSASIPPCGAEARSEYVPAGERSGCCAEGEGEKEERETEQP